jgi:hypothetical protein
VSRDDAQSDVLVGCGIRQSSQDDLQHREQEETHGNAAQRESEAPLVPQSIPSDEAGQRHVFG